MHHQFGYIQMDRIHDRANLVALCSICHEAFDTNEWTLIPEDISSWIENIEANPEAAAQIIEGYKSQRDTVFRRFCIITAPFTAAINDIHYKSAFTNNPTKMWPGEPGSAILRPLYTTLGNNSTEFKETLNGLRKLQDLWIQHQRPCLKANCPICQSKGNGKQSDKDNEDDQDNEDHEDFEDDDVDKYNNKEDGRESEKRDEDIGSRRKSGKSISKRERDSTGRQPPRQHAAAKKFTRVRNRGNVPMNTKRAKKLTRARNRGKVRKDTERERDWMTSTPYDESIPYSHRYGYTFANSTSNELMQWWQAFRTPVHH
ncbi:hypothetical protein MMC07_006696 [Pseudocyphellaria aurata]|nr:hypothetical protein [Pseudocyphellaria aurata]